jgi:hypothetical protein
MVAMWVLTFRSQPAQAIVDAPKPDSGKYKTTLYYGVIKLDILYHVKLKEPSYIQATWSNKGKLQIQYDEKSNRDNQVWIYFEPFKVKYKAFSGADSNPINPCSDIVYTVSAYSIPEDVKSHYFDPKENEFYMDLKIGAPHYTRNKITGKCKYGQTADEKKPKIKTVIDDLYSKIRATRLAIYMTREGALGGSCYLPVWESFSGGNFKYTDTCHWSAFQKQLEDPEWRRKK